ncbi:Uncharacterized protein OBRU01_22907 [Operophtera brumata]|uniref:Uncharacterized protein n=1 Tax=Operophtera brumata TaxID=104452 RepID=A0A0L7KQR9_OPEBR|nr:Uncharacterized protein OBRU01_22907 [Operophtera brumata]
MELDIEKLANDIDDVTDPSSFDKVLIYLEELQNEAEDYMELLVKNLELREITWEQPWYQGSSAITKPYQPFYDRNETETEKFRTDKFTKEEHDTIRNTSPEERARRFVAAYLARGLERTIHQVFRYIKFYNLSELEKRRYTKSEEKIMEVCFMHKFKEAPSILSIVLGRNSRGIYKRRMTVKTEIVGSNHFVKDFGSGLWYLAVVVDV